MVPMVLMVMMALVDPMALVRGPTCQGLLGLVYKNEAPQRLVIPLAPLLILTPLSSFASEPLHTKLVKLLISFSDELLFDPVSTEQPSSLLS